MRKRNPIVKTITSSVFAFALAVSSLASVDFASAAGSTVTWTGSTGDNKFSTANNWQGNTAPVAGDIIRFTTAPGVPVLNLTNDLGVALGGVQTAQLSSQSGNTYNIDTLSLQDGAVLSNDANPNLVCGGSGPVNIEIGTVSSTGSIVDASGSVFSSMTSSSVLHIGGNYTSNTAFINAGVGSNVNGTVIMQTPVQNVAVCGGAAPAPGSSIKGFTINGLVVQKGASVNLGNASFPITFGGGSGAVVPSVAFAANVDGNYNPKATTYTISGPITLSTSARFYVGVKATVNVTGTLSGSGSIQRSPNSDSTGILKVNGKTISNPSRETQLEGNRPSTSYTIVDKETAILNGTYNYISINTGGVLKGNGTLNGLYVNGTVSPGNSPGKIVVKQDLSLGSSAVFEAEILNKDKYDQLAVTGTVSIDNAKLNLKFIKGGTVKKGDSFTLISNGGSDAVVGTFAGLKEGAKITIGKAVFAISYKGGSDKNDVVLTALTTATAPGTPNTGFHIDRANPMIVALLGILTVALLITVAARRKSTQK